VSRSTYLGVTDFYELEDWCCRLRRIFGQDSHLYLVGSSMERSDWRDVDVRLMLPDDEFEDLCGEAREPYWEHARWAGICHAFSVWGREVTGLPIDFQIQRIDEANEEYDKPRNPMGDRLRSRVPRLPGGES
jgi:hypothetical protein